MSDFWPVGITLSDTQSPREILEAAQEDWRTNSDGLMDLVLQDTESESGNPIIVVHAKHVTDNRTATLFSVIHRPKHPYPVAIQLIEEDLPRFLKKSYYQPGSKGLLDSTSSSSLFGQPGHTVSNEWVADTPPEFRKKLASALNSGAIKGEILNLVSLAESNGKSNGDESLEDTESHLS